MFLLHPIILVVLMIIFSKAMQKPVRKLPPGPRPLPLIGNLHQFDRANPHVYLLKVSQKYGPLAYLKHGSTPTLVISSAKLAKEIMKTHDLSFCTRPPVLGQQKLSYGGIDVAFSPYDDHWKMTRKMCVQNLFSTKQVVSFRSIREDEVSRMIDKISDLGNSPANLNEIAMSIASNLICRVAFGRRYDDGEYEKMRFDRLLLEAQELMASFYFSDHFSESHSWLDKLSGKLLRLDENCKELDLFYQKLIDEHVNPGRIRTDESEDIIDLILHLKEQDSSSSYLTLEHLKALLMNLFVAGTDTVAAAIVWTMTALIKRPELMKKAQTEIREIVGKYGKVSEEDIKKLPYLRAVVFESLRLYPPAPLLYRKHITQDECFIDGYKIEPGTSVIINGWAISRDTETWENPEKFLPERFMADDQSDRVFISRMGGLEMMPFGGGRRGCPGMGMGMISIQLALANLLYSFDWGLPWGVKMNDVDTDVFPGLTTHKKNALVLVPCKYNC